MALDADLIAYYDAEARGEHRSAHGDLRLELRRRFAELLRNGEVRTLIDVGAGPGLDTALWAADGFTTVGVDLAHANVERMRDVGLAGVTGSLYVLPFRSETFDALWTMSTFVHVPHERFDEAITELLRVVAPGAPLGIGTWGGLDFEGVPEFGELRPYRFFSTRLARPMARDARETGRRRGVRDLRVDRPRRVGVPVRRPTRPELTRARTLRASGCRRRERRCRCRTTSPSGRTPAFAPTHA